MIRGNKGMYKGIRIGILGGSFNPIHIGHLILAEKAKERFKLDKVIFVPAYISPHKIGHNLADANDRFNMVLMAIKGNPDFEISDFEIKAKGKSYSIRTLKEFRKKFDRGAQLYFITGADSLKKLLTWKNIDEIFRISRFVIANRPSYLLKNVPSKAETFEINPIDVSSTEIRKRIRKGLSIRYIVPESARKYILKKRLYR